jgi:Holliday junction resolvase-like predicted endonuclease
MSRSERTKGARGERAAERLLISRGFVCERTREGRGSCDIVAVDPEGRTWAVEVKNRAIIVPREHVEQARRNAGSRRWMVLAHIEGTRSWLVLGQGRTPQVWEEVS